MGVLSGVRQFKKGQKKINKTGTNFFMVITGFDETNELLIGRILKYGNKPENEEIKVHFSDYYKNLSGRPTFRDLRSNTKSRCEIGFVYFVQQASLIDGIWQMRWGNIISRDIKSVFCGLSPAIVYPMVEGVNAYQRVSILDAEWNVCHSTDDILMHIGRIAADAFKRKALAETTIFICLTTDKGECSSHTFPFYSKVNNLDMDTALSNIEDNSVFKGLINQIESDSLLDKGVVVRVTKIKSDLVSKVRLKKSHKVSMFYQDKEGTSYWRDSIYIYQRVFSNNENKFFWSLQKCMPQSINGPFMPNAWANDVENFGDESHLLQSS